jgi:hypothetical protein
MQQLPLGALKLLQHWPAMQLELLLLTEDIDCKVLLLQTVASMLGVCKSADGSLNLMAAANSTIQPLLQLVVPHVAIVVKQLRAAAGSSTAPHTSSSSSIQSAADLASVLEQALYDVLLEFINGGEQLLWSATACFDAQAASRSGKGQTALPRVLATR